MAYKQFVSSDSGSQEKLFAIVLGPHLEVLREHSRLGAEGSLLNSAQRTMQCQDQMKSLCSSSILSLGDLESLLLESEPLCSEHLTHTLCFWSHSPRLFPLLACLLAHSLGKHLCIQQRPTGSCRLCKRREKVPSQNPEAGFGSKPPNSMILCYFIYLLIFNFGVPYPVVLSNHS